MDGRTIQLEVAGQTVTLRTALDDRTLQAVCAHVDEQLQAVAEAAPELSLDRTMLLVAMQLAETLVRTEADRDALRDAIDREADTLSALVDEILTPL